MLAASTDILSLLLGIGTIIGGTGYAIGQFFSARRKGVSDSLNTALDEVTAAKVRADRLAADAAEKASELAEVKLENASLRSVLTGGRPNDVINAINAALDEATRLMHQEHERTRLLIESLRREK